jgi:hypothetical protein
MPQAEHLTFLGVAAVGEVHEFAGAAGLSGKAGRRIARFDDQFGKKSPFILSRFAQNGLLPGSISQKHKGPEKGCGKRLNADEPVTPCGAAEDADFYS